MKTYKEYPVSRSIEPVSYDRLEQDRIVQEVLKKKEVKEVTREYVQGLAPWNGWVHITCRGGNTSLYNLQERQEQFFKKHCDDATYFSAFELHSNGNGWHSHNLVHFPKHRIDQYSVNVRDGKPTFMRKLWAEAFKEFGRSRIEPIQDIDKVTDYCNKHIMDYTTKGDVRGVGVYQTQFGSGEAGRRFYHAQNSD